MATPESELPDRFAQLSMSESRKHISPIDLENIVKSVTESNGLEHLTLPPSLQNPAKQPEPQPQQQSQPEIHVADAEQDSSPAPPTEEESAEAADTVDVTSDSVAPASQSSIVRGFSKDQISLSRRSKTQLDITPQPILKTSPLLVAKSHKKKGNTAFLVGGSDEGEESSLDSLYPGRHSLRDQVASREERMLMRSRQLRSEEAIDDSDDEPSGSAIEDDDDWEDEPEAAATLPPAAFQRQESFTHLPSRKSLITDQLHEKDRATALRIAASRSTPALRSSRSSSHNGPMVSPPRETVQRSRLAVQTGALPAATATSDPVDAPALSPRTNRRIMLQTELTSSLRVNMLWERQQKTNQAKLSKTRKCQSEVRLSNLKSNLAEPAAEPFLSSGYEEPKLADGEVPENVFDKGASLYYNHGW
jgi:hypothetical protein